MRVRSPASFRGAGLLGALAAILALAVAPPPAAAQAQSLEELVVQRRLEYRAARDAFDAARSAYSVVERQFSAALSEVSQARRANNDDRLQRAYAQAQDRSVPLRDQDRHLAEAREALGEARGALIQTLTGRQEQLVRQMDAARSAEERASLDALFRDISAELQRLEAEEGETYRVTPVEVLPEVTFDPRDGPDEIRAKAEILERQAAVADSAIQNSERQIENLNGRLRNERLRRDFVAGTDRFDDTRVPVVTGLPSGDPTSPTDSTVAGARPLTLEERIENLREYIRQLESYRDQLLIRATQFRRAVGSVA